MICLGHFCFQGDILPAMIDTNKTLSTPKTISKKVIVSSSDRISAVKKYSLN